MRTVTHRSSAWAHERTGASGSGSGACKCSRRTQRALPRTRLAERGGAVHHREGWDVRGDAHPQRYEATQKAKWEFSMLSMSTPRAVRRTATMCERRACSRQRGMAQWRHGLHSARADLRVNVKPLFCPCSEWSTRLIPRLQRLVHLFPCAAPAPQSAQPASLFCCAPSCWLEAPHSVRARLTEHARLPGSSARATRGKRCGVEASDVGTTAGPRTRTRRPSPTATAAAATAHAAATPHCARAGRGRLQVRR